MMRTATHSAPIPSSFGLPGLRSRFLDEGLVTASDLAQAEAHAAREHLDLPDALATLHLLSEAACYGVVAQAASTHLVKLDGLIPGEPVVRLVPERVARRHSLVPIAADERTLTYATCRPFSVDAENELRFVSGRRPIAAVATRSDVEGALNRWYPKVSAPIVSTPCAEADRSARPVAPVAGTVGSLMSDRCAQIVARAVAAGACELEVECDAQGATVRHRIGGTMEQMLKMPIALAIPVRDRFKALAGIEASTRTGVREGSFSVPVNGQSVQVRLSAEPSAGGEKLTMRLMDPQGEIKDLGALGYDATSGATLTRAVAAAKGLVLVAGPSGAPVGATLYALVSEVMNGEAVTIEDPIERTVPGVKQIAVNAEAGQTLPIVLRSTLLQAPKAIMVDRVRNEHAARAIAQAARSGRLVLTSIEAADAADAIARLIQFGFSAARLADSLAAVSAQNLLRTLCPVCRIVRDQKTRSLGDGAPSKMVLAGPGCSRCKRTGYIGHTLITETFTVTDTLRAAIARQAPVEELRAAIKESCGVTLRDRALDLVSEGHAALRDVERVLSPAC